MIPERFGSLLQGIEINNVQTNKFKEINLEKRPEKHTLHVNQIQDFVIIRKVEFKMAR